MSMFNHISCGSRDNEKDCESNAQLVSPYAKRFGIVQWSFLGPGSENRKDLPLQQYGERIEKLSKQEKLSKFCMDAGFLNLVEIGQYFMTKDTAEFTPFRAAACREYTWPRDEEASQPKGWIRRNTKSGPA